MVAAVLWTIWKSHNDFIFRAKPPDPRSLVDIAHAQTKNFSRWQRKEGSKKPINPNKPVKWMSPEGGSVKLNVDCSWMQGECFSSIARILRDSNGRVVNGFVLEVRASSSLQSEA
ncbi:hypothetical protein ACJRO7_019482 [Eucalyptus globulus]|uniref:Uncharacterized protein n=1 Tax=Eucalyptus globulus TaxID=34317 RepID=A0ABD3KJ81_EUCGL